MRSVLGIVLRRRERLLVAELTPQEQKQLEAVAEVVFADVKGRYPALGDDVVKQASMAAAGDLVGFQPLFAKLNAEGEKEIPMLVVEAYREGALSGEQEPQFRSAAHQNIESIRTPEELQGWIVAMALLQSPVLRGMLYAFGYRFKFAGAAFKEVKVENGEN